MIKVEIFGAPYGAENSLRWINPLSVQWIMPQRKANKECCDLQLADQENPWLINETAGHLALRVRYAIAALNAGSGNVDLRGGAEFG